MIKKLNEVKNVILELLKEHRDGISLAQLPIHLKKRISFPLDFNELGFPKLKDLLNSMSQILIEPRGANHLYAVLKLPYPRVEDLVQELKDMLKEFPDGITASRVQPMLCNRIGSSIDLNMYQCNNIYEFITKYEAAS